MVVSRRAVMLCTVCAVSGCARYGGSDAGSDSGSSPTAAAGLVSTSEVPVGGGVVLRDTQVVVTQPEVGVFKAFSAMCTHQGCLVSEIADGTINCTCHGSQFRVADGSVAGGPAKAPLPARDLTVKGDQISLA